MIVSLLLWERGEPGEMCGWRRAVSRGGAEGSGGPVWDFSVPPVPEGREV